MDDKKVIIAYHKRRQERLDEAEEKRRDGGPGSGNWGHVGRIGLRGGSEPGGGNAYRIENDRKKIGPKAQKYSSRSKIIEGLRKGLKDAHAVGDKMKVKDINKRLGTMVGSEKGNIHALDRKTAWNHDIINRMIKEGKMKEGSAYHRHALKMAESTASVQSINKNASRDVQRDKERGKSARLRGPYHGKTTKETASRIMKKGYR